MRAGLKRLDSRRTTNRLMAAVIALAVLAAGAFAGAVEVAKARSSAGSPTVTHAGKTTGIGTTTEFQEGDVVRVPSDGRTTIEFGDGASISLVGPATFLFGPMNANGRRMVLVSGAAPEIVVRGIAMEIQAPQPYDCSFVMQNARGQARVDPGESVTFHKFEGVYAKVWRGSQSVDLGETSWQLNVRNGVVSTVPAGSRRPGERAPGAKSTISEQPIGEDGIKIVMGGHTIIFHPAKLFSREATADGGLKLCFQGGAEDWGVVEIGLETTLFLAAGQCVEFDANGNIIRFDGIAHVYRSAMDAILSDEPIENAIDASPSLSRNR